MVIVDVVRLDITGKHAMRAQGARRIISGGPLVLCAPFVYLYASMTVRICATMGSHAALFSISFGV